MFKLLLSVFLVLIFQNAIGQQTFPVNGVHDQRETFHAFINAKIYASPSKSYEKGVLIIKEGKVVDVGDNLTIPEGSVLHNCEGLVIYPSFIDAYAGINYSKKEQPQPKKKASTASNWNPAIHPEHHYDQAFPVDEKKKKDWLSSGIGIVSAHHRDGIMRGTNEVFHLGIEKPNEALIVASKLHHLSFDKGSSASDYPSSHIGAVALIRQSFYDAMWYEQNSAFVDEFNPSLISVNELLNDKTAIFELNHALSWRNVKDISDEFDLPFIIKGTGKEYLMKDELLDGDKVIIPAYLPEAFDVNDPYDARNVSLSQLKHWEAAPYNAYFLSQRGAEVALSRDTISSGKSFIKNLQKIAASPLTHDEVLRMLTLTPASFLGIDNLIGSLETGKFANFFISTKPFDDEAFEISSHWNKGKEVFNKTRPNNALVGRYNLVVDSVEFTIEVNEVSEKGIKAEAKRNSDSASFNTIVKNQEGLISLVLTEKEGSSLYRLSGKISLSGTIWDGRGQDGNGNWISWAAIKDRKSKPIKPDEKVQNDSVYIPEPWFPNMAFGFDSLPEQSDFVITNAMVWTCADTGLLNLSDIWVKDGKIKAVGKGMMYPADLKRIDAKGKHVTPGIIDEHSHIAIRGGVNEWAQSSSAEVRISDAINPWNIHIYRHLSGGVTAAQLLHGSANPIGGQSALIKLKWGKSAEELLINDAPGFIKFALGENVKRSNRRDPGDRFPLTRMGVEQTFVDAFTRAKEYDEMMQSKNTEQKTQRKRKTPYTSETADKQRKDLELDALVEILNQQRFISCHSYVQSEILMLMSVADRFDFTVNTFTHILEGYKVAPELKAHGANASTFSDWWAYKFEVNDAIPYNAALLTKVGVNTAINSDDAEMGRRLNQEAAKTIKYGGISQEEALKMITINPAKALRLDHRMGSIEVGKDADLVMWSGHPLSVYSKAEKTFIEGIKYFDLNDQPSLEKRNEQERARIIAEMIKDKSDKKRKAEKTKEVEYHCDTILEDYCTE
ncbi:MAG: amidohydrolase family protein [Salibacteraceae bacterium]